ncbi:MAG: hypothetical protein WA510_05425, partial [Acidobacteriaceae bacterium]
MRGRESDPIRLVQYFRRISSDSGYISCPCAKGERTTSLYGAALNKPSPEHIEPFNTPLALLQNR